MSADLYVFLPHRQLNLNEFVKFHLALPGASSFAQHLPPANWQTATCSCLSVFS